jgi:peptidoglycan/LPS O-acetylase OafA/YrhL
MDLSAKKPQKLYFPNLNGLRALGASTVMIYHIEFYRNLRNIPSYMWFPIPGKVGVALFFALSGFLITSLLLTELESTSTIRLKSFYRRRILRIWPLYYLIIFLCFFIINRIPFYKIPVLSDSMYTDMTVIGALNILLIIPNLTHFYIPYSDQRWSITVEELFYLMQPALVKIFRRRDVLCGIFLLIVFSPDIFMAIVRWTRLGRMISPGIADSISGQLRFLGCIAVGCISSVLYFNRESLSKNILFTKAMQVATVATVVICVLVSSYVVHREEYVDLRIYCLLFSIIVVNAALNPGTIIRLENPVMNFLGKISYGIYMYHMIAIGTAFGIVQLITGTRYLQNLMLYPLSVAFSILIAWLSFTYFESFFLRLKKGSPVPAAA